MLGSYTRVFTVLDMCVLNNHNPSNQRSERIPLVLTYHPLNERIKESYFVISTSCRVTLKPE